MKLKELERGYPKKTQWNCIKDDMESLGLSQKDVQFRNGEGELRGKPANPGSPGKWPLKQSVCVYVCYDVTPSLSINQSINRFIEKW